MLTYLKDIEIYLSQKKYINLIKIIIYKKLQEYQDILKIYNIYN